MQTRARHHELLLPAFLATVVMLFAAFTAAYMIRRTGSDWRAVPLPRILWVSTAFVLAGSVTVEAARRTGGRRWLLATILLGAAFLAGQLLAWRTLAAEGITLPSGPHGAFLYMLTAVHGVHLAGGLLALLFAFAGRAALAPCAVYWHFVGAVWLYVFWMLGSA